MSRLLRTALWTAVLFAAALLALALVRLGAPAGASAAPWLPARPLAAVRPASTIVLGLPGTSKAGQTIEITATLWAAGVPVPDVAVHLFIDGTSYHQARTDGSGVATFVLRGRVPAGIQQVVVLYRGDRRPWQTVQPLPSEASGTITVAPLTLTLETVPATPGIVFTLDGGQTFVTGKDGTVTAAVAVAGPHTLAVTIHDPDQRTRITFVRWSDAAWTPTREVHLRGDATFGVALEVAYLTPIRFVDTYGRPLDPRRVSHIQLAGPNGESVTVSDPSRPAWLRTTLPSQAPGSVLLRLTPTPFRLTSARYDGLDVVFSGSQTFLPGPGRTWTVRLHFFTVRLVPRDALFGSAVDGSMTLVSAAGRQQQVRSDPRGVAVLQLPSGDYVAHLRVAAGMSPKVPFTLSRNEEVVIEVITLPDLLVLGSVVMLALLLLVTVRWRIYADRGPLRSRLTRWEAALRRRRPLRGWRQR